MYFTPYFLLILQGLCQYSKKTFFDAVQTGSCLSNPVVPNQLLSSSDLGLIQNQFTMVFWLMVQSTTDNYGHIRSVFQFSPTPSVGSNVLFFGLTPSTFQITSCSSNVACSTMYFQVDGTMMIGFWAQITISVDVQKQFRVFTKAIYTNVQQLTSNSKIHVDLGLTNLSFSNSNMYDFIPFNLFNAQPLCGLMKSLTIIYGLFTTDNSVNLDLSMKYLVYLPLSTLPNSTISDQINPNLYFNTNGALASTKKGIRLASKVFLSSQAPMFGDKFTVTFWMKASSLSTLSAKMPIMQYYIFYTQRRQNSKNVTTFLFQAQTASTGFNLLVSFGGMIAQTHGQFQLLNNQFYRVVLSCYFNYNIKTYVFSLFVSSEPTSFQSLFINSNSQLIQASSDQLIIGDNIGVSPWASTDTITVFDIRVFDGFSYNYPANVAGNCFFSVGTYPEYCLACVSYVSQTQLGDPFLNCNEASDYTITMNNYCPEGLSWQINGCSNIQISNCARAHSISTCDICMYGYKLSQNLCYVDESTKHLSYSCNNGAEVCEYQVGKNLSQILTCQNTAFYAVNNLQSSTCASACPTGAFFKNTYTQSCQACDPSCNQCFGSKNNECVSCSTALTTYFYQSQCRIICPAGLYPNAALATCSPCNSICLTCLDSTTTNCQSCTYSYYLDGSSCVQTCSSGKYKNYATFQCSPCAPYILTCFAGDASGIITCPSYFDLSTRNCTTTCPSGYFGTSSGTKQCQPCNQACTVCTDGTTTSCSQCNLLYGIQYYLNGNQCQAWCPTSTYADPGTNSCLNCDPSCSTCFGPANSQCIKCNSAGSTPYYFYLGQCLTSCLSGFYAETNNPYDARCLICGLACSTCTDSTSNQCSGCVAPATLVGTSCVSACTQSTTFKNAVTGTCDNCDQTCTTCIGVIYSTGLQPFCLTCPSQSVMNLNYCISTCPGGTYKTSDGVRCLSCPIECAVCSTGDQTKCSSCNPGYYLEGSSCYCILINYTIIESCSTPKFRDFVNHVCSNCDSSCATCDGASNQDCSTCPSNFYYYIGSCVSSCPVGYYANTLQQICIICQNNCYQCTDGTPSSCASCQSGYFSYLNQCMVNCPPSYYQDIGSATCIQCDVSCIICTGSSTSCSVCAKGYQFNVPDKCLSVCPTPYYTYTDVKTSIVYCVATCPFSYIPVGNQCQPNRLQILFLGLNEMYPVGASVPIYVIAVDLLDTPDLQDHGFLFNWTCISLKTNASCINTTNSTVILPANNYMNLTSLQPSDVLNLTVQVSRGGITGQKTGALMMSSGLLLNSAPFNYFDTMAYINNAYDVQSNSQWVFVVNQTLNIDTVIVIYQNTTIGEQIVTGKKKFTLKLISYLYQANLTLNSTDLYLYFYPQGLLKKMKINFLPTQGTLTVFPQVYVVPLFTLVTATFSNVKLITTNITYTIYIYTDKNLKNLDMSTSTFQNGVQLLQGAPVGSIKFYVPIGTYCYIICLTVDTSDAFSIVGQEIKLYGNSYPTIQSAIVLINTIQQNFMYIQWTAHKYAKPQDKVLLLQSFTTSMNYMQKQTYCSSQCSGNGQCDENQICQCDQNINFDDCSGTLDQAIQYNDFLGQLLLDIDPIQRGINGSNIAYFQQLQQASAFLLQNTNLFSMYYTIDVHNITSSMLMMINTSLQNIINEQASNMPKTLNYGIAIATQLVQATVHFINIQQITDILDQILFYTNIMRQEASDQQIDQNPTKFVNVTTVKNKTMSIIKQIEQVLIYQQVNFQVTQTIKSQRVSFYTTTTTGQNLINFFSNGLLNFTSLLKQPDQTYNQSSRRILANKISYNSISTVFNPNNQYILIVETMKDNTYAMVNGFMYPSAAFPYIAFKVFDITGSTQIQMQNSQQLNQSIVVWFPSSEEFSQIRRIGDYNGAFVCVQQDFYSNWTSQTCTTQYISVFYIVCSCSRLDPITVVEDYQFIILPTPVQPSPLIPIEVIIYMWIFVSGVWILSLLWGNLKDQVELASIKLKLSLDTQNLRKRFSISQGGKSFLPFNTSNISPTKPNEPLTKNMVTDDGKIKLEAFSIDEMMQLQKQFGDAMFTNIQIMAPDNQTGGYTPTPIEEEKVDAKNSHMENLLFLYDCLKTHTLIGALLKYKPSIPRVLRLALLYQRAYIILLTSGYFVQLQLPHVTVVILITQIFAIIYRIPEQVYKEVMKMSLQNFKYGILYRLIMFVASVLFIGLLTFIFYLEIEEIDGIFVSDWMIALAVNIFIDQVITETIIVGIRLFYRKKMKAIKLTQKFKFNKVAPELVLPPSVLVKKKIVKKQSSDDEDDSKD